MEGSLTWDPSLLFRAIRHIEGPPCLGSYPADQHIRHLNGHPGGVLLCSSVHQAFDRPAPLLFSCQCWCVERERLWWWFHSLHVTQQYRLASMAAWLSSSGVSHNLLPHIPLIHLSTINNSLCPGIAPQSLNSSSQPLGLLGDCLPVQDMYGCSKDCLILIPFRLPHISCFTLSLKWVSSDSDNCPAVGIRPLLQFPQPPRAGPILVTLLFFSLVPLSYHFAWFYIFFPTGQVLLSTLSWYSECTSVLKVYSWCIHGNVFHAHLLLCHLALLIQPHSYVQCWWPATLIL